MLLAEVGYTPGESAATGLASISHDIGGHNGAQYGIEGAEPRARPSCPRTSTPAGCSSAPSSRSTACTATTATGCPWQYPAAANASAKQFLNLREDLVPLTYTLAAQATATGTPILQPLYLQYPEAQESYAMAGSEYLYGPDVLVAPVTTANDDVREGHALGLVPGRQLVDRLVHRETYAGGTTADVTTGPEQHAGVREERRYRPDPLAARARTTPHRSTPSP